MVAAITTLTAIASCTNLKQGLGKIGAGAGKEEVRLKGLSHPVRVIRDAWGIPHIYAQNRLDLMRAFGYVQAEDRLFQIEVRWRFGEGRLAEIFGRDSVERDYVYRLFDPERFARENLKMYPADTRAELEAFAAGINEYIDRHQNGPPVGYRLLGVRPTHVTAADLEAASLGVALEFGYNLMEESVYLDLARRFPPATIARLFPVYPGRALEPPPSASTLVFAGIGHDFPLLPEFAKLRPSGLAASNNWVVDGSMTASGKPMLANDPHLGQSLPSIWYEAVLVTPDGYVAGASLPGSPAISVGTNGHVAWGSTSVMVDVIDLSMERLSSDGGSYLYRGQWSPIKRRPVTIRVKDAPEVRRMIRSTRHGPLVSEVLKAPANPLSGVGVKGGYALSMRFAGLRPGPAIAARLRATQARSGRELVESYRHYSIAPLNLVWADDQGNIGWRVVGAIPNRVGFDGKYPMPVWDGKFEWKGMIPFDKLPHVENPASHFIVTANNRMTDVPYNGGWVAPWRHDRIARLLNGRKGLRLEDFKRIQTDDLSPFALKLRDALVKAGDGGDPNLKWAISELGRFDGRMTVKSRPAAIVAAGEVALAEDLFKSPMGAYYSAFLLLQDSGAYPAIEDAIVRDQTPLPSGNGPNTLRPATLRAALSRALTMLEDRLGADREKWTWGALAKIRFAHTLTKVRGWHLNRGPMPFGHGRHTIDNGFFLLTRPFNTVQISSYRYLADMAAPEDALAMNHTGESGDPTSAHYDDMLRAWMAHRYHQLDPRLSTAEAAETSELDLVPR